jgi:hypothetical protein
VLCLCLRQGLVQQMEFGDGMGEGNGGGTTSE